MTGRFSDIFNNTGSAINNQKIEEVIEKTRDAAESFGKKSAERLEISRKMVECLDSKTKLNKLYERFGELQYNAYIGEQVPESDVDRIANEIAALKERIQELTEEIEVAKIKINEAVANAAQKTRDAFQKAQADFNGEIVSDAEETSPVDTDSSEE